MRSYNESCNFAFMEKEKKPAEPKPYKTFPERLAEARKETIFDGRELTQTQLAKDAGTTPQVIQHLEANDKSQGSRYTAQIARRCGVDPYWLATGLGEKKGLGADAYELAMNWLKLDDASKAKAKEFIETRIKSNEMVSEVTNPRLNKSLTETGKLPKVKAKQA